MLADRHRVAGLAAPIAFRVRTRIGNGRIVEIKQHAAVGWRPTAHA
jgi:hypothetical protein